MYHVCISSFFRYWPFRKASYQSQLLQFAIIFVLHSSTYILLKLCKPGVLIHLMELTLISSIKKCISIFQLVCRAHLKGLGHNIPYFSTGYASC